MKHMETLPFFRQSGEMPLQVKHHERWHHVAPCLHTPLRINCAIDIRELIENVESLQLYHYLVFP